VSVAFDSGGPFENDEIVSQLLVLEFVEKLTVTKDRWSIETRKAKAKTSDNQSPHQPRKSRFLCTCTGFFLCQSWRKADESVKEFHRALSSNNGHWVSREQLLETIARSRSQNLSGSVNEWKEIHINVLWVEIDCQ
jgi:hypothetical protein